MWYIPGILDILTKVPIQKNSSKNIVEMKWPFYLFYLETSIRAWEIRKIHQRNSANSSDVRILHRSFRKRTFKRCKIKKFHVKALLQTARHYTVVERACKKPNSNICFDMLNIKNCHHTFKNVNLINLKPQLEEVSFCRNIPVLCICDICVNNNNRVLYLDLTFTNVWHQCQTIHKLDYVCQLKETSWNLLSLCLWPVISISILWNKILKTLELYFRTTSWFELIIISSSVSRREMEQFQRIENWNYFLFPRTVELDVVRDI